jgi:iron-regulated transporter 1
MLNNHQKLYLSHALTSWTDRSFEFASYLLISRLYTSSLLQSSVYGLTTTLAALVLSNQIGNWINILSRLNTFRVTLVMQKISIVVSTVLFHYLLLPSQHNHSDNSDNSNGDSSLQKSTTSALLYAVIIVLGCTLKLSFIGNSIAIEKDWAYIISEGHLEVLLPTMRRIDLVCKTVSPILVGFLLAIPSPLVASVVICAWTTVSAVVEYILVSQIHRDVPALYIRAAAPNTPSTPTPPTLGEESNQEVDEAVPVSFREYIHHKTFLITLSIGMLYINVLSFGGTMTSYLVMIGYTNSTLLGIMKAVSGVMGVAGTYAMPLLAKRIGNVRTGLWSIWQLVLSLSLVLIAIAEKPPNNNKDATPTTVTSVLLFGGMAASRLGLWMFDLSESLILQDYTSSSHITSITGWQFSMCNLFDLLQFVLTIVWSDPGLFVIPAGISVGVIVGAAVVYTGFVWKDRGHLLHHIKLK